MSRIAAILTDWFEDSEHTEPVSAFEKSGHKVVTVGPEAGQTVKGKKSGTRVKIDQAVADASSEDFDALLIPGGFSPDKLRVDENAVAFVKAFIDGNKPVFAICHAPQLLITADVLRGRTITGYTSIIQLFGGAPATALRGKGALQDIEQLKLFDTLVKWSTSLKQDCDMASVVEEAFDVAQSGIPGPVFIECPIDLLYDEQIVRQWYTRKSGPDRGGLKDRVTQWYLRRHVDKLFACSPISEEHARKDSVEPFYVDSMEVEALDYGRQISRNAFHIAVNRSKKDLKRNKKPNLAVNADPCTFLLALAAKFHFPAQDRTGQWLRRLQDNQSRGQDRIREYMQVETDYINPVYLCEQINRALDENSVIVGDGGDFVATASYMVNPRKPLCWLDPGPYGTLGVGAGFALAAALVRPDAQIWILYGDGAAGYSLMELDTFVRHGVPVIAVVGNDAGWTQITRDQVEILQDDIGTRLRYNKYHEVAGGLEAKGFFLSDKAEIESIFERAKTAARSGRPVLINALIGKTDFRKGSISM